MSCLGRWQPHSQWATARNIHRLCTMVEVSFHAGRSELPDFASTGLGTSPREFLPKKSTPSVKSHYPASTPPLYT